MLISSPHATWELKSAVLTLPWYHYYDPASGIYVETHNGIRFYDTITHNCTAECNLGQFYLEQFRKSGVASHAKRGGLLWDVRPYENTLNQAMDLVFDIKAPECCPAHSFANLGYHPSAEMILTCTNPDGLPNHFRQATEFNLSDVITME